MGDWVVSILIPTYNRARYLRCLLADLAANISGFKHSYEIVISDNASSDGTEGVVQEFLEKLNIRYLKRDRNHGAYNNWVYLRAQAKGVFQVYLADDDSLILPELSDAIDRMLMDPQLGVVYSPIRVIDRVTGQLSAFYKVEQDVMLEQGEHLEMLNFILDRPYFFPEIHLVRSEWVKTVVPFKNAHAYWAFVNVAEYLSYGKVLLASRPFYLSTTRYFADEPAVRDQVSTSEVQDIWDSYRGGLEYIQSRIQPEKLDANLLHSLLMKINKFIGHSLATAIQTRVDCGRDPVDTYYLACRTQAMGFFVKDFDTIRYQAMVHFLLYDQRLNKNVDKIMCVGALNEGFLNTLLARSTMPVYADRQFRPDVYEKAIVLIENSVIGFAVDKSLIEMKSLRLVGVADLLQKFL